MSDNFLLGKEVVSGANKEDKKKSLDTARDKEKTLKDIKNNLEEPQFTPNAIEILEKRYLNKDENIQDETPKDLLARVADFVSQAEYKYNKSPEEVLNTAKDFYNSMARLEFFPNSPTLRGAGTKIHQLAGCFVLPIEDSMEGIFDTLKNTALVQKGGGGTGFSFGRLRPKGDKVGSTGGVAGGPLSFMNIFDTLAREVMQGGTRVGANMGILPVNHPDILEWITCKANGVKYQNFNLSVAVTDDFMKKIDTNAPFDLINPRNGKVTGKLNAGDVYDAMIENAWKNGDPGIIFIDKMNKDNPTPTLGKIESTNPCVVGETLIATNKGLEKIEDIYQHFRLGGTPTAISTDDRVIGKDQISSRLITKIFSLGQKTIAKIQTKSGYQLKATLDHKIFTSDGWVAVKDLKIGDKILLQNKESQFSKNYFLPIDTKKLNKGKSKLNLPNKWSKELGQTLGLLVGDGWLKTGDKNCRVGFTFSKEDKEILDYAQAIINNWYNKPIKPVKRENGVWHLSYHSKNFIEFFKNLGVKALPAAEKEVPQSILTAPKEAIIGFLQGLFTADGTVGINEKNNTNYIRLTSKSIELLKKTQLILLNLGIRATIYDRSRKERKIFPYTTVRQEERIYISDGICFELHIPRENIKKFLNQIGFIGQKHSEKIKKLKSYRFYRENFEDVIVFKKIVGKQEVYDLTEPITYSFITNGFISLDCGEQPLLPYESCNLGSINLAKFVKNGQIEWEKLEMITKTAVRFLDNVIDMNKYFVPKIEELVKGNRKIGLGVMGFADMLVDLNIAYNSDEGIKLAEKIMKFIEEKGREASIALAEERGVFPNWEKSIYAKGKNKLKLRNATITTIAPTGTLSLLGNCAGGIEPFFAISFKKKSIYQQDGTASLEQVYVNPLFEKAAKKEKFYSAELMAKIANQGSLAHLEEVPESVKKIFVTAHDISPEWHMEMQAAFQKYTDNAVSKTINFPKEATIKDIKNAYILAYKLGCKGLTVYRDGSKDNQVLTTGKTETKEITADSEDSTQAIVASGVTIVPRERPEITRGYTYRVKTAYGKLYVTINDDDNGWPFEIFSHLGKAGGFFAAKAEAICRLISLALRSGVDPEEIIDQLKGIRGPTPTWSDDGKMILSLPDAIAQVLEKHVKKEQPKLNLDFNADKTNEIKEETNASIQMSNGYSPEPKATSIADYGEAPACPDCGAMLEMGEGCLKCLSCGYSKCA